MDGGPETTVRDAFGNGLSVVLLNHDLRTSPDFQPVVRKLDAGSVLERMASLTAWSRQSKSQVTCGGRVRVSTTGGFADAFYLRKNAMTSDVYGVIRTLRMVDDLPPEFSYDDVYEVTSRFPSVIIVNDIYFEV